MRNAFYILLLSITLLPACDGPQDTQSTEDSQKRQKTFLCAVEAGDLDKVKELLAGGVDVNAKDEDGKTALHRALLREDAKRSETWPQTAELVKLLVESGADVSATDNDGRKSLDLAQESRNPGPMALLLRHGARTDRDPGDIAEAAMFGDMAKVREFLEAGQDVDFGRGTIDWTALQYAAVSGDYQLAELLIASGANVNGIGESATPLSLAVGYGHRDVVTLLLRKGADVNGKGIGDYVPLHAAAMYRRKEIAKLLIIRGAHVNAKEKDGITPLHLAVKLDHSDVVRLLVANGADLNAIAEWSNTPLDYAKTGEMKKLLRGYGAVSGEELMGGGEER